MVGSIRIIARPALIALAGALAALGASASAQTGLSEAFRAQAERVKAAPTLPEAQALFDQAAGPLEKYVAAALMVQAASAQNDLRAERKALNVLFETKGVPAAELPKLHNQAGVISLMLNDPQDAIAQIRYAEQLGYKDIQGQVALADALARTKDGAASMTALASAEALGSANSAPMVEGWYDRAIALAASTNQIPQIAYWGQRKLTAYPSDRNWRSVLIAYLSRPGLGIQESLDLYRLAAARNALVTERDWLSYATIANNAGLFSEAKAALDAGFSRGAIPADMPAVKRQLTQLTAQAKKQLAEIPAKATAAGKSTKGDPALDAADGYFASAQFEKAIEFYQMALSKGATDKDRATTRLGIAQLRNGDLAGGATTLANVTTGPWVGVSGLWLVPAHSPATAAVTP